MENENMERILTEHGDRLYRLCLVMLGNPQDAEDAVQETLLKYLQKAPEFGGPEHEKAWLLTVAANKCRDQLRFRFRHPQVDLDSIPLAVDAQDSGILDALMTLPDKFRLVLILHYVEGYTVKDMAAILRKTPSAIKMRLQKGRRLLEECYRKEYM